MILIQLKYKYHSCTLYIKENILHRTIDSFMKHNFFDKSRLIKNKRSDTAKLTLKSAIFWSTLLCFSALSLCFSEKMIKNFLYSKTNYSKTEQKFDECRVFDFCPNWLYNLLN